MTLAMKFGTDIEIDVFVLNWKLLM